MAETKDLNKMNKFRLVLNKLQGLIDEGDGAYEGDLKALWNDLSDAITAREKEDSTDKRQLTMPVVMASSASNKEWISSMVKCDLCGFEWVAVYHISCDKLECNSCGNMVDFENLP